MRRAGAVVGRRGVIAAVVIAIVVTGLRATPAHAAGVTASPTTLSAGTTLSASWWCNVGEEFCPATTFLDLVNVSSGAQVYSESTNGSPSGSTSFTVPASAAAGPYQVRIWTSTWEGSYVWLASSTITVVTPAVSGTPTSVVAGNALTSTWSGIVPPAASDRIDLLCTCAPDWGTPAATVSTNAQSTGSSTMVVPAATSPNTYTLRLFHNGARLATSGTITVQPPPPPTVSGSPTTVIRGSSLTVSWSNIASPATGDRVNLAALGSADTSYVATVGTGAAAAGSTTMTVPADSAPGSYELRLFSGANVRLATSGTITVNPPPPTVAGSPTTIAAGASITATWTNIWSPQPTDWIALASLGSADTSFVASHATTGAANGSVSVAIAAGVAPGTYELRLFAGGTNARLATSGAITVTPPAPSVQGSSSAIAAGAALSVSWANVQGPVASDWIGLFAAGAADTAYVARRDTTGGASGTASLIVPASAAAGTHELRLFSGSSGAKLATSAPLSVLPVDAGARTPWALGHDPMSTFSHLGLNVGSGSYTTGAEDLFLPGRRIDLRFVRTYSSADVYGGPFGPGWTHSYNWSVIDGGSVVEVRRGDGRRDSFARNADGTYTAPPAVFDTLVRSGDGTFTLTHTDQSALDIAADGRLTRVREPAGNQIALTYSGTNLTTITDTVGRQVTLSYDASGRITQLTDPLGRRVTYLYDASGRLVAVTDKLGNAAGQDPLRHRWVYAYDGTSAHLATLTDPDGRVRVTNTYDTSGRVTAQLDGRGSATYASYGTAPGGLPRTVASGPLNPATTYDLDARLWLLSRSDVMARDPDTGLPTLTYTLSYTYDAAGDRLSATDRGGNVTRFTYDARGNVLTRAEPAIAGASDTTVYAYDAKNNLTQITDPLGYVTTRTYDPTTSVLTGESRQVSAGVNAVTTYQYTDAANPGLPTRVTSPRGFATTLAYTAQGLLASATTPDAATTTYTYDAAGRRTGWTDPDGGTWSVTYDENDRETRRADPLGNATTTAYDGAGDRTAVTDPRGNVTTYTYDATALLSSTQQSPSPGVSYTTSLTRTAAGLPNRITAANGTFTDHVYDPLNRLTHETVNGLTQRYQLDPDGRVTTLTRGDNSTVTYAYDARGRETSRISAGVTTTTAYDGRSQRTQLGTSGTCSPCGTSTYAYDGLGRLTSATLVQGTLAYSYDLDGDRTALGFALGGAPSRSVSYAYSPGGRMTSLTDWSSRTSTFTYTTAGRPATTAYPGGMTASYAYDAAGRLTSVANAVGGTTVSSDAYTLDAAGNRAAQDEFVRGITPVGALDHFAYQYDGLSRLTSITGPLAETFAYDAASNLSSYSGPLTATYSYDAGDRLTGDGSTTYSWTAADTLASGGPYSYGFDPERRLSGQSQSCAPSECPYGTSTTFAYDGDGLLLRRDAATGTPARLLTSYLWDVALAPAPLLAAWPSLGGAPTLVVQGPSGPLYYELPDGSTRVLARDGLGSVRAEVDAQGYVTRALRYLAYGGLAPFISPPTLLGYSGELRDDSPFSAGLIYLRARWYDPKTGRFLSPDPVRGDLSRPASLNRFGYAEANPVVNTDPSGMEPQRRDFCGGIACGGGTGGAGTGSCGGCGGGGGLGVVYRRTDATGGKPYIGQAKSEARYLERQREHSKANRDADYDFEILGNAPPGKQLDRLEEYNIRRSGGPTNLSNPQGALANRRHQMNDWRYNQAGGEILE